MSAMTDVLKLKKSNCKNCYKCIRHCPVKSIRFSGNQAHIVGNECILCGQCFVVCPQGAKEISDSTEQVRVLLGSGAPVYVSLAPSFIANYNGVGIEEMRRALLALGFAGAEETAIGATIVKREYERLLWEEKRDVLISSCCHSVNLLIQKHFPTLLDSLADVVSPMQAHAQAIKQRVPEAKVVFVGPCVAKKDEAQQYPGIVDGVLTFEELTEWFAREKITLEPAKDTAEESRARLFPTAGGILKTMDCTLPEYTYLTVDGVENCMAALRDIADGRLHGCFIEMSACAGSCVGGPVMEKYHRTPLRDSIEVHKYAGKKDFAVEQPAAAALRKNMDYIPKEAVQPSESEIEAVLRQMGKPKPSDELNCGSCGYNTCREKAVAVCQGKAEISMCLPYLKERAENFSESIIGNMPSGIVVLNDKLEVQQINRAALKMMNLARAADVLGEPVVRILDPSVFMQVLTTQKTVRRDGVYLAEYNKYVDQTVLCDNEYHLLVCMLRDVTEEITEREKKDEICCQTAEVADKVVEKQMRIVQEIASLLGETAAETKIALTKLKESMHDE